MKIHDEIEDWMAGALCDALTPDEQKNFEQHLAQCPHCRSLYEENQKMNDLLNQTLPELRPDQNFERRVIAAFREKIARGSFHPWSGLVWFVQFRTVRAALALLLIAAMVKGGSMISGERFAGGKAYNARDYARMQANNRALINSAQNLVIGEIRGASTDANGISITGGTNPVFNGSTSDTRLLSGTLSDIGNNLTINSLTFNSDAAGHNTQVLSGRASWHGTNGGTWATGANWADAQTGGLDGAGAPGVSGQLSTGDTATFGDVAGEASKKNIALGGNQTWNLKRGANTPLTVSGAVSGGHGVATAGNITFGGGSLQYTAGNTTDYSASFPVAAKDTGANSRISVDLNGASSTLAGLTFTGTGNAVGGNGNLAINGGALRNRQVSGASPDVTKTLSTAGGGNLALTGANTYSGTTTINGGVLNLGNASTQAGGPTVNFGSVHAGTVSGTATLSSTGVDNQATRVVVANGGTDDGYFVSSTGSSTTSRGGTQRPKIVLAANEPHPGAAKPGAQTPAATQPAPAPLVDSRKLIRNAALDFEVLSFEKALDTISGVAGEEQGYVFSQNSAKGPNGKLQGQIIVKVLPPNLDRFLLKLRLLGDMKNQTVSAQDVSKDYYDTVARIRNSQVTEERLIDMMKTRTGKVSDLLEVENEITRVRGEIEQMQGTLQVYDAQVQYATVTITLQEKDINQTAAYLLQEHAQLSLFAKDVEKAFTEAKSDAADAKSQTLESHLERDGTGHVIATLHLLIPPDASEVAIDKLKAIGRIDHFNAQTERVARDGNAYSDTAKVDRDKVELNLVIQQDAENAVQGTNISVLTDKVEDKTAQIKEAAAKEGIEVKGAEFNRAQNGVEVSGMLLRMPVKKYAAFLEQIKSLGKVKDFTVARREDATATDDAPAEIALQIYSQGSIVAEDTGLWVTVRGTLGEGMAALMWSLRMIGVSLAFIAPWAIGLGLVAWLVARRRRAAQKQG